MQVAYFASHSFSSEFFSQESRDLTTGWMTTGSRTLETRVDQAGDGWAVTGFVSSNISVTGLSVRVRQHVDMTYEGPNGPTIFQHFASGIHSVGLLSIAFLGGPATGFIERTGELTGTVTNAPMGSAQIGPYFYHHGTAQIDDFVTTSQSVFQPPLMISGNRYAYSDGPSRFDLQASVPYADTPTATWSGSVAVDFELNLTFVIPPAELDFISVKWIPVEEHDQDVPLIEVEIRSQNYSGPVQVSVRGTDNLVSVNVVAGQITKHAVPVKVTALSLIPKFLIVDIDAKRVVESNRRTRANNTQNLTISDRSEVSGELTNLVIADTPRDRVFLWLRQHRELIQAEAEYRDIAAEAIAGAIAWEALVNVGGFWKQIARTRTRGPGKVHVNEDDDAATVERLGYLPRTSNVLARFRAVSDPAISIRYIAAIMDAYADAAERAGAMPIRSSAYLLTIFYHGFRGFPTSDAYLRLPNADAYFIAKVSASPHSQTYVHPLNGMASWLNVAENLNYLTAAISGGDSGGGTEGSESVLVDIQVR